MMRYLLAILVLAIAAPASAELIFFSETRSMSVKSHRFEGDRVIVALRGGGEMAFDRSVVVKIAPDEVPYPHDTAAQGTQSLRSEEQYRGGHPASQEAPVGIRAAAGAGRL